MFEWIRVLVFINSHFFTRLCWSNFSIKFVYHQKSRSDLQEMNNGRKTAIRMPWSDIWYFNYIKAYKYIPFTKHLTPTLAFFHRGKRAIQTYIKLSIQDIRTMVLWEITLGTAYFLGLKRTYKLALKIQRRLVGPKHPKIRQFLQRYLRSALYVSFNLSVVIHFWSYPPNWLRDGLFSVFGV